MSDASGFFDYSLSGSPGGEDGSSKLLDEPGAGFLEGADEREWEVLLSFTRTRYVSSGEVVFARGDTDRALYLLTAGRIELSVAGAPAGQIEAPAPLNLIAFLDRGVCDITATALAECELLRLSFEAFESLASREPVLARTLLLDVGQIVAQTLRAG